MSLGLGSVGGLGFGLVFLQQWLQLPASTAATFWVQVPITQAADPSAAFCQPAAQHFPDAVIAVSTSE